MLPLLGVGLVGWWWFKSNNGEMVNPLDSWRRNQAKQWGSKRVIGFLPPWLLGKTRDYCDEISHLVFLGVEVGGDGNLVWDASSKKIYGDEYKRAAERVKKCGGKSIAGFKLFDDKKLDELFGNTENLDRLSMQIKEVVKRGEFDGVNIDFEYQNDPTKILREEFLGWLGDLRKEGVGEIESDVFVNTINKTGKETLDKFLEAVDDVVIMAYDFHRPGSDYSGAVAPIGAVSGERSIGELVERIEGLGLDKSKICLAFPLYGYEWKTVDDKLGAEVVGGWYQTASYKRAKEIAANKEGEYGQLVENWDELSMTPWLSYKIGKQDYQVYFENEKSLGAKLDLAKKAGVGGIGFWALGYEGDGGEVWKMVGEW